MEMKRASYEAMADGWSTPLPHIRPATLILNSPIIRKCAIIIGRLDTVSGWRSLHHRTRQLRLRVEGLACTAKATASK